MREKSEKKMKKEKLAPVAAPTKGKFNAAGMNKQVSGDVAPACLIGSRMLVHNLEVGFNGQGFKFSIYSRIENPLFVHGRRLREQGRQHG